MTPRDQVVAYTRSPLASAHLEISITEARRLAAALTEMADQIEAKTSFQEQCAAETAERNRPRPISDALVTPQVLEPQR